MCHITAAAADYERPIEMWCTLTPCLQRAIGMKITKSCIHGLHVYMETSLWVIVHLLKHE